MKNITKKGILFIAVALFSVNSTNAFAYVPGVWDPQPRVITNETGFYKVPMPVDAPLVPQTNTTTNTINNQRVVTTNQSNTTTSTVRTATPTRVVNNTSVTNRSNAITTPADVRQLPAVVTIDQGNTTNDLAALSLAGSGGFMPSSVWQWLFVILLILAVIILFRMLTRANHHESHVVNH